MSKVEIRPVESKRDLKKFVKVPFFVHRDHPEWVPPLIMDRMDFLNRDKNPYFDHAEVGLWLAEKDGQPVTTAICVHDGDLAGLFEVATAAAKRGQGHARNTVLSALKWARLRGARTAWLQVETGNYPAVALYNSIGFRTLYFYHYRKPAEQAR